MFDPKMELYVLENQMTFFCVCGKSQLFCSSLDVSTPYFCVGFSLWFLWESGRRIWAHAREREGGYAICWWAQAKTKLQVEYVANDEIFFLFPLFLEWVDYPTSTWNFLMFIGSSHVRISNYSNFLLKIPFLLNTALTISGCVSQIKWFNRHHLSKV